MKGCYVSTDENFAQWRLKMLLNQETFDEFGYYPDALTEGSKKRVCLKCDYCNQKFDTQYKNRNNSYKKLPKDCCSNCKSKKREEISLITHGVKNSAQRPEVRQKIADSGWIKSDEFAQKRKETMLKKYGVEYASQSPELLAKTQKTVEEKYGSKNVMSNNDIKDKSIINSLNTKKSNGSIYKADGLSIDTFTVLNGVSNSQFYRDCESIGFEGAISKHKKLTSIEKKITSYLDSIDQPYELGYNVANFWPDIKIGNLLIEADGNFYHSCEFLHSDYHFNKKKIYTKFGFDSLFIRGDEINTKFEIVKSIINKRLGNSTTLIAQDLYIKSIDHYTAFDFMKENHLSGSSGTTSFSYGLFLDAQLVSAIQFKKNNSGNDYRISRFCDHKDFFVKNSLNLFIKTFKSQVKFNSVIKYLDLRFENYGSDLEALGFFYFGAIPSFKWTDSSRTFSRMKFPGSSGYDNGLRKLWDCGQSKYILTT